jgi:hypothetical protein
MNRNQAKKKLADLIGSDTLPATAVPSDMNFNALVERWTAAEAPALTVPTRDSYQAALRAWISPTFGNRPIAEITRRNPTVPQCPSKQVQPQQHKEHADGFADSLGLCPSQWMDKVLPLRQAQESPCDQYLSLR